MLLHMCGSNPDGLRNQILMQEKSVLALYRGFARFMLEDLEEHAVARGLSRSQRKRLAEKLARCESTLGPPDSQAGAIDIEVSLPASWMGVRVSWRVVKESVATRLGLCSRTPPTWRQGLDSETWTAICQVCLSDEYTDARTI